MRDAAPVCIVRAASRTRHTLVLSCYRYPVRACISDNTGVAAALNSLTFLMKLFNDDNQSDALRAERRDTLCHALHVCNGAIFHRHGDGQRRTSSTKNLRFLGPFRHRKDQEQTQRRDLLYRLTISASTALLQHDKVATQNI